MVDFVISQLTASPMSCRDTARVHASPSLARTRPAGTIAEEEMEKVHLVVGKRLGTLQRNERSRPRYIMVGVATAVSYIVQLAAARTHSQDPA